MAKSSLLLLFLLHCSLLCSSSEFETLLNFKSTADFTGKFISWNSTTDPCKWTGVSCVKNRVSRLVLEKIELLASLTELRVLSLKRNHLSGPIPDLSKLTALKLLFLSHNQFSGEFPSSITSLSRLHRLDFSSNNFSGEIPPTLTQLTHLLTLRLESNRFSGPIPDINPSDLQDFNVSSNNLNGQIPYSLSKFPETVFKQNPSLCGAPLLKCSKLSSDPTKPGRHDGANASPLNNPETVPSSPTSIHSKQSSSTRISTISLIAIIIGDFIILSLVSLLLYYCFWRQYAVNKKKHPRRREDSLLIKSLPNIDTEQQQSKSTRRREG